MANFQKISSAPRADSTETRTNAESCVPKNASWFKTNALTRLFTGAKLCGNPDVPKTDPKGIEANADSVMDAHKKAEKEGRKASTAELAKAFLFPKK